MNLCLEARCICSTDTEPTNILVSFFTNSINQFINLISQSKRSIHTFNLFLFIKFQHSVFPFPSFILVTIFKFNIPFFSFFSIFHAKNIEYCCIFINTNAFIYAQCIYFFYSGMKHISNLLYQFLYLFISFFLSICFLRTDNV